jgi:hypothetical protein
MKFRFEIEGMVLSNMLKRIIIIIIIIIISSFSDVASFSKYIKKALSLNGNRHQNPVQPV